MYNKWCQSVIKLLKTTVKPGPELEIEQKYGNSCR